MLKSIHIENFQSHRDSKLKFSSGVNVIFGDPQNGKTAILRALNLVATNRPSGFRYHSHFATTPDTKVTLETTDGSVQFVKGETSGAAYSVTPKNESTISFPKPGVGVPDKVSETLNLAPLNIQSQLDGPFLIGQSPADIAREINRITKIDLIDKWSAELNRRKHATTMMAHQMNRKAVELEAKAESLAGIQEVRPVIKEAEVAAGKAEAKKAEWNTVRLAALALAESEREIARLGTGIKAQPFVENAGKKIAYAAAVREQEHLCQQLMECEREIEALIKLIGMAGEALSEYSSYKSHSERIKHKFDLVECFVETEKQIQVVEKEIEDLKRQYADKLVASGVCNQCFSPITENAWEHILEHL